MEYGKLELKLEHGYCNGKSFISHVFPSIWWLIYPGWSSNGTEKRFIIQYFYRLTEFEHFGKLLKKSLRKYEKRKTKNSKATKLRPFHIIWLYRIGPTCTKRLFFFLSFHLVRNPWECHKIYVPSALSWKMERTKYLSNGFISWLKGSTYLPFLSFILFCYCCCCYHHCEHFVSFFLSLLTFVSTYHVQPGLHIVWLKNATFSDKLSFIWIFSSL